MEPRPEISTKILTSRACLVHEKKIPSLEYFLEKKFILENMMPEKVFLACLVDHWKAIHYNVPYV